MMIDRRGFIGSCAAASIVPPLVAPSQLADVAPLGPWRKLKSNPLLVSPFPGLGYVPENIVRDPATGLYWTPFTNFNNQTIGVASSPDLLNWQIINADLISAPLPGAAPHLLLDHDGLWHLYYSKLTGSGAATYHAVSANVMGPYSNETIVLAPIPGTWEAVRVMEVFVFLDDDGLYKMFYMGDAAPVGSAIKQEQVGYATAPTPAGPFTRYGGNPVIAYGLPGSFDAGATADPFVVKFNGIYYVFYTAAQVTPPPWPTALVTSTDLVTFTKQGIVLPCGDEGEWDSAGAIRGGVIRIGDIYYFLYAGYNGVSLSFGLAVAPAKGFYGRAL